MTPAELAKKAVKTYINEKKIIDVPLDIENSFKKKAGVFVTIKKNNNLRACIGTFLATKENVAKEIIKNAISAATNDYRFGTIEKEELSQLSYAVYVLEKPKKISSTKELNPKKCGIIVKSDKKTGLLLPGLKNIKNTKEQIFFACKKANIDPKKESIEIYKFEAKKYN